MHCIWQLRNRGRRRADIDRAISTLTSVRVSQRWRMQNQGLDHEGRRWAKALYTTCCIHKMRGGWVGKRKYNSAPAGIAAICTKVRAGGKKKNTVGRRQQGGSPPKRQDIALFKFFN